jgi:hypothetical protein
MGHAVVRVIYTRLHHEPFEPEAKEWEFLQRVLFRASTGVPPGFYSNETGLASAGIPAVVDQHDRTIDAVSIPRFRRCVVEKPDAGVEHGFWRTLDELIGGQRSGMAMFARIVLRRLEAPGHSRFAAQDELGDGHAGDRGSSSPDIVGWLAPPSSAVSMRLAIGACWWQPATSLICVIRRQ